MRKVCAKMVPKNLTNEQKANRRDVCLDLLDRLEREPEFFSRIITGDESCILEYDPETTPKSGVAHCKLSPSQESKNEQIQKQIDAPFVFLTVRGSSTRNLCHQDKMSIKLFIGNSLKDSGNGWHVCDKALHSLGCCTTTTPHVTRQSPSMNFWQKKAFLWLFSLPIRRISVPVTSFYSPGSKTT